MFGSKPSKFEEKKPKSTSFIYDFNFRIYNMSGFGILENPKKWEKIFYSIYHKIMHSTYCVLLSLFITDAYLVKNDKEKLNLNLCVTLLATGSLIKIWTLMNKLKVVVEIRRKFREDFNLPYVGQEKLHEEIKENKSRELLQITKALYGMITPGALIWVVFPLVDPSSKERKYCIPFPLLKNAATPTFELVYAFHTFVLVHFVLNVMNNDLSIFGYLIRICEQFDILICNISKIKDVYPQIPFEKFILGYQSGKSDTDENGFDKSQNEYKENNGQNWGLKHECLEKLKNNREWRKRETIKLMRQNIVHHRCILQQLRDIEYAYGGQLFVQLTLGAMLLSVVAFDVILQSRKFNAPLFQQLCYVGAVCVDIFFLCYYGTQISEKSEQVAQALYDTPWHEMDATSKKICSFMIAKCRRNAKFRAKYVFSLNLETYLSLVKTSYNIIALLNETK